MTEPTTAPTRLAIVGTAGHIDHGKTAMVRRLTGVDTDRLPEEKQRGISIDLGFAPLVTPGGVRVGLVDVPGHERFVKNMLAGSGGIDLVLLVIAADEGPMPQTREHLSIVRLLGVTRAIVVLSKVDLVEPDWLELVKRDVAALMQAAGLDAAPIVEFSAVDGRGTDTLLAEIDRRLADVSGRALDAPARLPVDRVFTMEGFGTVVTGTLWRGTVKTGDVLELQPAGRSVRVRRVQVHGATVEQAHAGQRTALALHGVDRDQVTRGDWVVTPGSLHGSRFMDVRFELLSDQPKEWKNNARVRFHIGASEVIGRVVLLDHATLRPGESALAQLRLERPAVAARGDRFVVRAYSPARTVGGGTVIEPLAERRRRHGGGLESLAVHEKGSLAARLLERLDQEKKPVATATLAKAVGESEPAVAAALEQLVTEAAAVRPVEGRWLGTARWVAARERIERDVRDYAERHPARYGVPKGELKRELKNLIEAALFDPAFDALVDDGAIEQRGEHVRPAGVPWEPPAETLAALRGLETALEAEGLSVPDNASWQKSLGRQASEVAALGFFLERLVRVNQDLTCTSRQMEDVRAALAEHFTRHETIDMAGFKERFAVSRKYSVPIAEHCDRVGWTVRVGDVRKPGGKL